jgi:hypothetical protein
MQLNPELLNNRVHRSVVRELTQGLFFECQLNSESEQQECLRERPAWRSQRMLVPV